jgi:hypothetical protein
MRDVAFGERDDVDAGEGEALEETGGVFLIAAEAVQRFGEHDIELSVQRVAHQRLEAGPKERGTRDRVIGVFLDDRPALASGKLAADADLVRNGGIALIIRGVPRVDRNLHCTVTSGRSCRCAISSRANSSRAACRASVRTSARSGSSRRSPVGRGLPRRARRLRCSRDRIITLRLLRG